MKYLFLFLTFSSFAFEDLDRNLRKKIILSSPDFSQIDNLIQDQKAVPPVEPFELYTPPVEDWPVVKLMIKEGTPLKDPKTGIWKNATRDIIVTGKLIKKTGHYEIYDKNNKVSFEINSTNAILVDKALDIAPVPKEYITHVPSEKNKPYDKKLFLTHSLSLNKQTIDATYFSEFFNIDETTADALKLDYKLFHKTDFPIAFGIIAALEYGDYAGSTLSGSYLGGGLKAPLRISDDVLLEAHLLFERSFFLKVKSTKIQATFFQGNIEAIFKDKYFLNLGYNVGTFSADSQWIMTSAGSNKVSSVGIGLGIKFYSDIKL